MTPRNNEVGVVLEPHEIAIVQKAYVDCDTVRESPINPETNINGPMEFSVAQVNAIGRTVLVGATDLELSLPRTIGARLFRSFEARRVEQQATSLRSFYKTLHDTAELSKSNFPIPHASE